MKKAIGVSLLSFILLFSSTPIAGAVTIAELQAQINVLMQQLQVLQSQTSNIQENPNGDTTSSSQTSGASSNTECPLSTTGKFRRGDRVQSTYPVNVRNAPGGAQVSITPQPTGSSGIVLCGPRTASIAGVSYTWWQINFDIGSDGWVAETFLNLQATTSVDQTQNTQTTNPTGPRIDIKANGLDGPVSVANGSTVRLSWTATSGLLGFCSLSQSGTSLGAVNMPSNTSIANLTTASTFTINCINSSGVGPTSLQDSVVVNFSSTASNNQPSILLSGSNGSQASDTSITANIGSTITISGTPQNLTSGNFTRAYFFNQTFGSNNQCGNNEATATGIWTMTCTARVAGSSTFYVEIYANGQTYRSNTITVTIPSTASNIPELRATLSANPSTISAGQFSRLTLDAVNAQYCLWPNDVRMWPVYRDVNPTQTTTYTATCYNSAGQSTTTSTRVNVGTGTTPNPSSGTAGIIRIISASLPEAVLGQPYSGSIRFSSTVRNPISVFVTSSNTFYSFPSGLSIGGGSVNGAPVTVQVGTDGTAQLNISGTVSVNDTNRNALVNNGGSYVYPIRVHATDAQGSQSAGADYSITLRPTCLINSFPNGQASWSQIIYPSYTLDWQNLCQSLTISGGEFSNRSLTIPQGSAGYAPQTVLYAPTTYTLTAVGRNGIVSTKSATYTLNNTPSGSTSCNIVVASTGNSSGYRYSLSGQPTPGYSSYPININGSGNTTHTAQPVGSYVITYTGGVAQAPTSITPSSSQSCSPGGTITYTLNFPSATQSLPPVVSISANPTTITLGQSSTLLPSSQNATTCSGNANGLSVVTPTQTTTYTYTCTNSAGTNSASVTVTVNPTQTPLTPSAGLSVNSSFGSGSNTATAGTYKVLDWTSTNATSCSAPWMYGSATSGSQSVGPINQTTTYTVTCSNSTGSATGSVTISVSSSNTSGSNQSTVPPTISSFYASPSATFSGNYVTLSWSSSDATSCSGSWMSGNATSGSQYVGPVYQTTSYSLTCTGAGGSVTSNTVISVSDGDSLILNGTKPNLANINAAFESILKTFQELINQGTIR